MTKKIGQLASADLTDSMTSFRPGWQHSPNCANILPLWKASMLNGAGVGMSKIEHSPAQWRKPYLRKRKARHKPDPPSIPLP
jgi:hypothetical protein